MRFFLYILLLQDVFCFQNKIFKKTKTLQANINPLAFENVIQPEPFNELIKRIDNKDVDSVFFSNNMKKIYSRKDVNEDGEYDLEDYTITNSDSISDIVIDHATKYIRTVILEQP